MANLLSGGVDLLGGDFIEPEFQMTGRRYTRQFRSRARQYDLTQFNFWLNYFESLAIAAFEWEGLPEGIDPRAVEYVLLHYGIGAIFSDCGGYLFAQAAPADNINMFYNPNRINLYAPSGQFWERHCNLHVDPNGDLQNADAVACFDNMTRRPLMYYLENYARRLATIDRVIDVNVGAQRTPWIISGPEEAKGSKKHLISELEANEQFISVNDQMGNFIGYEVLNTNAPYVADKLHDLKNAILNEAVTFIGIDNANTDKRERLNTQEVLSNNEQVMTLRNSRMKARKDFCKRVGDLWGLVINVKWAVPHLAEQEAVEEAPTDVIDENGVSRETRGVS